LISPCCDKSWRKGNDCGSVNQTGNRFEFFAFDNAIIQQIDSNTRQVFSAGAKSQISEKPDGSIQNSGGGI